MSDECLEELHLRRLLVAVDGSASGRLALRAAITAAKRDNAAISLLTVAVDAKHAMSSLAAVAGAAPIDQAELDAAAEQRAHSGWTGVPRQ